MKTEAIVVAAGVGKRLNGRVRKPYLNLSGKPVLVHTLKRLNNSNKINSIIVVVNKRDIARCGNLVKKFNIKKVKKIVAGGKERQDSVYSGLKRLDKDTDIVLVHDGVRPFVDEGIIENSISCAKIFGACVVGVPVKATIKKLTSCRAPCASRHSVRGKTQNSPSSRGHFLKGELGSEGKRKTVERTVDRHDIWEIQTPQVFRKEIILKAYKKFGNLKVTDDSMLVEKLGVKVRVVLGSYKNIKITTPEDLMIAKGILRCA